MSGLRFSRSIRLAALLAFLFQIAVAAFHYHEDVAGHGIAGINTVHVKMAPGHDQDHDNDFAGHHRHSSDLSGNGHHPSPDNPGHDEINCDLCVLKSAAGQQLAPEAPASLIVARRSQTLTFPQPAERTVSAKRARYQPRAPPRPNARS